MSHDGVMELFHCYLPSRGSLWVAVLSRSEGIFHTAHFMIAFFGLSTYSALSSLEKCSEVLPPLFTRHTHFVFALLLFHVFFSLCLLLFVCLMGLFCFLSGISQLKKGYIILINTISNSAPYANGSVFTRELRSSASQLLIKQWSSSQSAGNNDRKGPDSLLFTLLSLSRGIQKISLSGCCRLSCSGPGQSELVIIPRWM